jgi:NTP pyrophosphatase (non-canonical NTP hydrolase)
LVNQRRATRIKTLQSAAYATAKENGFHPEGEDGRDPVLIMSRLALIHSEVSEGTEAVRDGDIGLRITSTGKPEGLASELADTVIRCFDLAQSIGIDLEDAVLLKMEYNKSRPLRHGRQL